jgi:hypothetical protein
VHRCAGRRHSPSCSASCSSALRKAAQSGGAAESEREACCRLAAGRRRKLRCRRRATKAELQILGLSTCRGLIAASSAIRALSRIAHNICSSSVYAIVRRAAACGDEKE